MKKRLSSPISTGGGGTQFEYFVQASYIVLLLTGGYAPCMPCWPIKKIKLQGKVDGFETDDLIVFIENHENKEQRKMLGQIKRSISITKNNQKFAEVIYSAWDDFNHPERFNRNRDSLALITGPLCINDTKYVKEVLDQARFTKGPKEFLRNITQANFISNTSRKKLEVFRHTLRLANGNVDVSDNDLYQFLKHFYLIGYDLERDSGVVLSLINSHISQFNKTIPQQVWESCVVLASQYDRNAGTISEDNIPYNLKKFFRSSSDIEIPSDLIITSPILFKENWNQNQYATDLALLNLIGSWNENYEEDVASINRILNKDYKTWIQEVRETFQIENNPFTLLNGEWKLNNRMDLLKSLGPRIFDQNLEIFKTEAIKILAENDPKFELPNNQRFSAILFGKKMSHSISQRRGISESLAILGNNSNFLSNCSIGKVKSVIDSIIRKIFIDADWVLWGSINDLLPNLAEASPNEFLNVVDRALHSNPCPFDELFAQEGVGILGDNYLRGLLWALEVLAWDESYLVRVCLLLGELTKHDPGGTWANRPINSLTTIFLPWHPNTNASIEKRKVAIQTLCKENSEICWKLLISLLPNQHRFSLGTYKPKWFKEKFIKDHEKVLVNDYWEQIENYANQAIILADHNPDKLSQLVDICNKLPISSFNKFIDVLSSESMQKICEEKRNSIWNHIQTFLTMNRRYTNSHWRLKEEQIAAIKKVEKLLAPSNLLYRYQNLFSENEFQLFENDNWKDQRIKLSEKRQKAIREIYHSGGIDSIIHFVKLVSSPSIVGYEFGIIKNNDIDDILFPSLLTTENKKNALFIKGFINRRLQTYSWEWIDELNRSTWDKIQIAFFLTCLPFIKESWDRANLWLEKSEGLYWAEVIPNSYHDKGNLETAIEKLLEHKRPYAAINCLHKMIFKKQSIQSMLCIKALQDAVKSTEFNYSTHFYEITDIIKYLQNSSDVSLDDLAEIEWAYLALLNHDSGTPPITLENLLAKRPEFFCEIIQLIYRSSKVDKPSEAPSESLKAKATHALDLLYEWKTPPGTKLNGSFDESKYLWWFSKVKDICLKSGHIEVALIEIGKVLIYSPPDPQGLWINKTVAETLNGSDADKLRDGFCNGFFNSRGIHEVDPTGKLEKDLAKQYRQKASDVENAGFQRLATALRSLAQEYDQEAERIIAEHSNTIDY